MPSIKHGLHLKCCCCSQIPKSIFINLFTYIKEYAGSLLVIDTEKWNWQANFKFWPCMNVLGEDMNAFLLPPPF